MRLLIFTNQFPDRVEPLRGIYNLQQMTALSRHCEVRVVAPQQWFPFYLTDDLNPRHPPYRDKVGGLPTWHPYYGLSPGIGRGTHALQMFSQLLPPMVAVRREYPFDAIIALWAYPDVVTAALFARLWKVPLIAAVLGSDINVQTRDTARRRQILWGLNRAHRILAVSHALKERVVELGILADKIMVHHNGVDRTRFFPGDAAAARRKLGLPVEGKHVLFVGFLQPAKAVQNLVLAVARLKERGELEFTTHLVGNGPDEGSLRALVESRGAGGLVQFHGGREHPEIPLWMTAADVFCLPSVREGCPNVILEALASGRPLVASRVGGIPELVTGENAILVPPSDPEALAAALREAVRRPWDPRALSESVARFDWDISARALYEAACEALAARSPAKKLSDREGPAGIL